VIDHFMFVLSSTAFLRTKKQIIKKESSFVRGPAYGLAMKHP